MTKNSFALRSVSALAIVGLSMGLGAPAAFATAGSEANTATAGLSTIDTTKKGTLTIHKQAAPARDDATGTEDDAKGGTAIPGIEFTIYKVKDIDVTTNAGLAAADGKTAADYVSGNNLKAEYFNEAGELKPDAPVELFKTDKTDENGQIVLDDLGLGAYLVIESNSVVTNADGTTTTYTPAVPFLAFVPMTAGNLGTEQGTTWNYDVHAVPKNAQKTMPVKEVKDAGQNTGGTYVYDIKTTVRNITEGKKLAYYWIEDTLDEANLNVDTADISVYYGAAETPVDVNKLTAMETTDYDLVKDPKFPGNFVVKLTGEGLAKLKSGVNVVVHVEAEKKTDAEVVPNDAREYEPSSPTSDQDMNGDPQNPGPGDQVLESEPVFTYSSGVEFTKVDAAGKGLPGAEFVVVRATPSKADSTTPATCDAVTAKSTADGVTVASGDEDVAVTAVDKEGDGTDIFTSGDGGIVKIEGLHVNDWVDGKEAATPILDTYCLVETKAPAGKELLADPIPFELVWNGTTHKEVRTTYKQTTTWDANGVATTVTEPVTKEYDVRDYDLVSVQVGQHKGKVVNLDDTTPQLPLTGGAGIGVLAGIGAALVGIGAWFARRNTKKA